MNLYLDCRAGAAGDMLLAALLDLGADFAELRARLDTLRLTHWDWKKEQVLRGGIAATLLTITDYSTAENHGLPDPRASRHPHEHNHHHEYPTAAASENSHRHARKLGDFLTALANADFSPPVKQRAEKVFRLLAEVEGEIHQKSPEEIHFHEISGIDSLIDICGVCLAVAALRVEKIFVSPLQVGGGFVHCAHGKMPAPAPATLKILERARLPFAGGLAEKELLTPTGAALLAVLADEIAPAMPAMQVEKIGYGAGARDFPDHANAVCAVLFSTPTCAATTNNAAAEIRETLGEIRFAVDDATGEEIAFLRDQLLTLGALDCYALAATMKKGRPGTEIAALFPLALQDRIMTAIFTSGITLGLRYQEITRISLPRRSENSICDNEKIAIKTGCFRGQEVFRKAEYEDCARAAEKTGQSLKTIREKCGKI